MSNYKRKKPEERKAEILETATLIFLEKGYAATSMEDIIAKTSLSKGGFYHYYKNTKDIMADLIREKNYKSISNSEKLFSVTTKEELRHNLAQIFVERMFDNSPKHKLHLMMAYELVYEPEFLELYQEQEKATLNLILSAILKVEPQSSLTIKDPYLLLLYRINNTLHFVENLYHDREEFGLNRDVLFDFYYSMLLKLIP